MDPAESWLQKLDPNRALEPVLDPASASENRMIFFEPVLDQNLQPVHEKAGSKLESER